ncbi:phosphate transport system substrate-binding protein [Cetobacterium ceti]|uniref:Phosphate-binding protein n=1 Tax=Cetobacterium ceti TaxID=180163 RepID=A0A1T4KYF5_9FUSO|nr:PstS family phosphate ABC transporter substrate-binding protein [Cetobacterium ceti]SJZ47403.1 phosphate transport system substrate-binding protein [Cetobacterium ceti]
MKKALAMGLMLLVGGFGLSKSAMASRVVQMKGSDTILNVSQYLAEEYMLENKDARIAVTGGGSGVGIASLINGTGDIGMASRNIKSKEIEMAKEKGIDIKEVVIGFDGITIIENKNNPVKNISSKDLGKIFRGEITNWKEIGGNDAPIVVLSRDSSSGTHEFFKEHIVRNNNPKGTEEYGIKTLYMPSNEAIKQEVETNVNAIGYIGMGYVDKNVKSINVDNIEPNVSNVSSKKYPIAREIYWYVKKEDNKTVNGLVNYALSKDGQEIVKEEGFVPIN